MSVKTQYDPIIQIEREAQPPHSHHTATTNHYQKHIHAYHSTDTLALWLSSSSRLPSFSSSLQTHWQRTHGYCWTIHSITQSLSHLLPPFLSSSLLPTIAPAANPRPAGSMGSKFSMKRKAGTAMMGWGRDVKIHLHGERQRGRQMKEKS